VPVPEQCKPYVVYVIEAAWAQGTFIDRSFDRRQGRRCDGRERRDGLKDDDLIIVGKAIRTQELCDQLSQVKAAPLLSPPFDGIPVIDPGRTI
jgi:hypothetical protein